MGQAGVDASVQSVGSTYCTYCSEAAVGVNASKMPICGIPNNHLGQDDNVVVGPLEESIS